jgi:ribosomal protein L16/L10AE
MPYYIDKYPLNVQHRGSSRSHNNMQALHRLKSQFNQKTRKRKYKARVTNAAPVRSTARGRALPSRNSLFGFRVKRACRASFSMFIAAEKAIMATKQRVWIKYRRYPGVFVTKKSSKSRMGKGKGKIWGRLMKIERGEVIFDAHVRNPIKSRKWVRAVRRTLPVPSTLVYKCKSAERAHKNFLRLRRARGKFRVKRRKPKKWQIQVRKVRKHYSIDSDHSVHILDMVTYLEFLPKHERKHEEHYQDTLDWLLRPITR